MANQMSLLSLGPAAPVSASAAWTEWGSDAPYHGASYRRESMRAWNPSRGSADRDVILSLDALRSRARDLVRNVPVASAAVTTMTTNTVGTGLRVRPRLNPQLLGITQEEADTWEARARAGFELWANSKNCDAERKCTFPQLQDLAQRTQLISGDCFALMPYKVSPASPFGLCVKLLDSDRCQNPTGWLDSDTLAGGVEVDIHGAPVAYHFTSRPLNGLTSVGVYETVRVPAFGAETGRPLVLHLFKMDRPDQRRGVSWLAPVIEPIKQQGRYQDAEIMAAVVSGMYTVFVKTPSGSGDWDGNVPEDEKVTRLGVEPDKKALEMKYGGVVDLAEGEDVTFANPGRPNPNYEPFTNAIFREIGAGLGLPYEVIMKYFSSSYTAARAAFLEGWKTFRRARLDMAVNFCQPVYESWLMEAVSTGFLEAPGFFTDPLRRLLWSQSVWVGDAPGQLDPLKETQAYKLQVDEQFRDRDSAIMEIHGGDYETIVRRLSREQALREENGVREPGTIQKTESISLQNTGDGNNPDPNGDPNGDPQK